MTRKTIRPALSLPDPPKQPRKVAGSGSFTSGSVSTTGALWTVRRGANDPSPLTINKEKS